MPIIKILLFLNKPTAPLINMDSGKIQKKFNNL